MVKIQRISAIALTVTDIESSIDFYTQALGFETIDDIVFEQSSYDRLATIPYSKVRLATLKLGKEYIELIQYLDLEAKPIPQDSQSNDLWFQHLAIVVSDIDRAYEHLRSFPIEPISTEPQTIPDDNPAAGVRAFKFRELDRHSLELIWFPKDKSQAKWQHNGSDLFLGIDHSAIAVANTQASLKFYQNLLGMKQIGNSLNQGQVQANLDGLPVAEVKVTPLLSIANSIGIELLDYLQPKNERSIPSNWQINDLSHLHFVTEVKNIELSLNRLRQQGVNIVSPNVIDLPDSYRYQRGCLIKDPDGHSLLLVNTNAD